MSWPRIVTPEMLDHLAPDDPAARRSRHDLLRVHGAMGTRAILARRWQQLLAPQRSGPPLHILELGAGDGRLLLRVAADLAPAWPPVHLCLLERQDIVAADTLAGFARLGWQVSVELSDVRAWATRRPPAMPDTPSARWDLITTTLFLHHFQGRELRVLLAAAAERCDRFLACEPRRSWGALAGSHLVGALGANAVTREDAVLSVRAGFRDDEISARWPRPAHAGAGWASAVGGGANDVAAHNVASNDLAASNPAAKDGDRGPAPSVHPGALRAARARQARLAARAAPTEPAWQLQESPAGLFSHCFSARRAGAPA